MMKLLKAFFIIYSIFFCISCSSSDGDDPAPDDTLSAANLAEQQWAITEFNGIGKRFVTALADPNIDDDTLRTEWDYLAGLNVAVGDNVCNRDNTIRFDNSNGRYEVLTNAISCSTNSQTEVLENTSTNTWRIVREGETVFLDFFQFFSIERPFFFDTDAFFKNFNFNPLSSPYRFELLEGDNTTSTLKFKFEHFYEGEDQINGSASNYSVLVNLTLQKVN